MSGEQMNFPESWREFLEDYSFLDSKEVYTNRSKLIPVFRVEQMVENYWEKEVKQAKPNFRLGRWELDVERSKKHIENIYACSNCKTFEAWGESEKTNYCPYCGARMEETTPLIDKSELLKVLIDQVIEVIRDFPTEKEK